jgi:hypothetical protein
LASVVLPPRWADDRDDLPASDLEAHPVEGLDGAEPPVTSSTSSAVADATGGGLVGSSRGGPVTANAVRLAEPHRDAR